MPTDPTIAFGILKCRDLVQLYYGARLVANVIETNPPDTSVNPGQILSQDLRRIRYEIIFSNNGSGAVQAFLSDTLDGVNAGPQIYTVPGFSTIVIDRTFLTDLDAVTLPLFSSTSNVNCVISVRETFLTPAPIDEGP